MARVCERWHVTNVVRYHSDASAILGALSLLGVKAICAASTPRMLLVNMRYLLRGDVKEIRLLRGPPQSIRLGCERRKQSRRTLPPPLLYSGDPTPTEAQVLPQFPSKLRTVVELYPDPEMKQLLKQELPQAFEIRFPAGRS